MTIDAPRLYAFFMSTGSTTSEAHGLRVQDVRLDVPRPVIRVQGARDMKTGDDGAGKTRRRVRDVPIHPYALPLLRAMLEGKLATDCLFALERVRDSEKLVAELRSDLVAVGVTRPELHEGTRTLKPFDVRSFRTTFPTSCKWSGFDAAKHYVKGHGRP